MSIEDYDANKAERDIRGLAYLARSLTDEVLRYDGQIAGLEEELQRTSGSAYATQAAYVRHGASTDRTSGIQASANSTEEGRLRALREHSDVKRKKLSEVYETLDNYVGETHKFAEGRKADLADLRRDARKLNGSYRESNYERGALALEVDIRRAYAVTNEGCNALQHSARALSGGDGPTSTNRGSAVDRAVRALWVAPPEYVSNSYDSILSAYVRRAAGPAEEAKRRKPHRPRLGEGKNTEAQSLSDKVTRGTGLLREIGTADYTVNHAGSQYRRPGNYHGAHDYQP